MCLNFTSRWRDTSSSARCKSASRKSNGFPGSLATWGADVFMLLASSYRISWWACTNPMAASCEQTLRDLRSERKAATCMLSPRYLANVAIFIRESCIARTVLTMRDASKQMFFVWSIVSMRQRNAGSTILRHEQHVCLHHEEPNADSMSYAIVPF